MDLEWTNSENVPNPPVKVRPLYIRDMTPERGWPSHLETLLCSLDAPISLHHMATAVAFVLCVEVGFVPEMEGKIGIEPHVIMKMSEDERLALFASSFPDTTRVQHFYAFGLRAIVHKVNVDDRIDEDIHGDGMEVDGNPNQVEIGYDFSPRVKLLVEIRSNQIFLTAIPEVVGHAKDIHMYFHLNLHRYLNTNLRKEISGESYVQRPTEWMSEISINGPKLSHDLKSKLGLPMIDALNGISPELRGLQSLPKEVLLKIFKLASARTLANVGATSLYLDEVSSVPELWRRLLLVDFGSEDCMFRNDPAVIVAQQNPRVYTTNYKAAYQRLASERSSYIRERVRQHVEFPWEEDYDDDDLNFVVDFRSEPWFL